jgi:hypothetical protein
MMKKYLLPIVAIALLLMILFSSVSKDRFELTAADTLLELLSAERTIDPALLSGPEPSGAGLIYIGSHDSGPELSGLPALQIEFPELGSRKVKRFARSVEYLLIQTEDELLSNQAWIVLTQMGYKNVHIPGKKNLNQDEKASFIFVPEDPENSENSDSQTVPKD